VVSSSDRRFVAAMVIVVMVSDAHRRKVVWWNLLVRRTVAAVSSEASGLRSRVGASPIGMTNAAYRMYGGYIHVKKRLPSLLVGSPSSMSSRLAMCSTTLPHSRPPRLLMPDTSFKIELDLHSPTLRHLSTKLPASSRPRILTDLRASRGTDGSLPWSELEIFTV
jgi:hypothetical protein